MFLQQYIIFPWTHRIVVLLNLLWKWVNVFVMWKFIFFSWGKNGNWNRLATLMSGPKSHCNPAGCGQSIMCDLSFQLYLRYGLRQWIRIDWLSEVQLKDWISPRSADKCRFCNAYLPAKHWYAFSLQDKETRHIYLREKWVIILRLFCLSNINCML